MAAVEAMALVVGWAVGKGIGVSSASNSGTADKKVARAFLTPRTKVARKFAAAAHKKRVLAPRGGVSVISIAILRYADNLFLPDLPSSLFSAQNHRLSLHFLAVITYLNSSKDVPS